MSALPLQSISISNFRALDGQRTLPLDAPIVLLHGPNGTGKTSVLSALELGLTGEIRSMQRHDSRYFAHLPSHGNDFAAVRVEVSTPWRAHDVSKVMTVGATGLEGLPALDPEKAQFYSERCFLDQASLGRLLEIYQHKARNEESALARFVNELLGLEQLDALRMGLDDAGDYRRLRQLVEPLVNAENEVRRAEEARSKVKDELKSVRASLGQRRNELTVALERFDLELPESGLPDSVARLYERLSSRQPKQNLDFHQSLSTTLAELGGRIQSLSSRPSVQRLTQAETAVATSQAALDSWQNEHSSSIDAWATESGELGVPASGDQGAILDAEVERLSRVLKAQGELIKRLDELEKGSESLKTSLHETEEELSLANAHVGSLVEGLAAVREHLVGEVCPVCDRDFADVSTGPLYAHIDRKIDELTSQGSRLRELRARRDEAASTLGQHEQLLNQMRTEMLSAQRFESERARLARITSLRTTFDFVQPLLREGERLRGQVTTAKFELAELESTAVEADLVRSRLDDVANRLDIAALGPNEPITDAHARISQFAEESLVHAMEQHEAFTVATSLLKQYAADSERADVLSRELAAVGQRLLLWADQVKEAKRRQRVAKDVQRAASDARAAIVQRVFTKSLNDVWRSVFSRLAPREQFVPAFGLPTSSRRTMDLTIETVHKSGDLGGSPQMMLSAGNLNTAALSLFIALHLAVEPLVPCLVFDDPVQSMDEVHISQFAGLMRILAKRHDRQIVIAVHERALFEYLTLELSPAFEGDKLITIELGSRSADPDQGVNEFHWEPDRALAG